MNGIQFLRLTAVGVHEEASLWAAVDDPASLVLWWTFSTRRCRWFRRFLELVHLSVTHLYVFPTLRSPEYSTTEYILTPRVHTIDQEKHVLSTRAISSEQDVYNQTQWILSSTALSSAVALLSLARQAQFFPGHSYALTLARRRPRCLQ